MPDGALRRSERGIQVDANCDSIGRFYSVTRRSGVAEFQILMIDLSIFRVSIARSILKINWLHEEKRPTTHPDLVLATGLAT